ncbi:hypothetical protein [Alicyclobacillus ferrooxydans]|uniref:Uncharacterized protein n=1 Tax=Alicyclobacillus ferrooxydans TaxID=471514 RepID=A0A0P9EKK9_9BACL|nr:hypothetical protein [Alicyclobacillus ferrooxydans]KPV43671.1 hypothetical protein AN477_10875 [Alicyclobacillus ferrooxydans]
MVTFWLLLDILAIVATFGFGVAINMVFRRGWVSPVIYIVFSIYLMIRAAARMTWPEWILFFVGLIGALLSGYAVRSLRKRGYSLFTR